MASVCAHGLANPSGKELAGTAKTSANEKQIKFGAAFQPTLKQRWSSKVRGYNSLVTAEAALPQSK